MSDKGTKEDVMVSNERTEQHIREYVQLAIEEESERRLKAFKSESCQTPVIFSSLNSSVTSSGKHKDQQAPNNVYGGRHGKSISTIIKNEALRLRRGYHSLDIFSKASVCLGLNSILDIGDLPANLEQPQWEKLQQINPSKRYKADGYEQVLEPLRCIETVYDSEKTFEENWSNLYKELKQLEIKYSSDSYSDINFCIRLLFYILTIIKQQPHLFKEEINCSGWDHVVKFWGIALERLFRDTELGLTWNDTHLTISDIFSKETDLEQRKENPFNYLSSFEFGEEDPVIARFVGDECKVLLKSKAAINNFINNGSLIDSVDSLQFSGLNLYIMNTTLSKPGLYVVTALHSTCIKESLSNFGAHITLASHLLCFRDRCVTIYKQYYDHLKSDRSANVPAKRVIHDSTKDDLVYKQNLIRGNWYPPLTSNTPPPPPPENLFDNPY
ncbi:uncharacterized protein EV154DRAFT_494067 [Mucor mucedo]|uniref:uncharacterized protein n=1 Tax=Mucor mucedo TaxID=29922 RepID=UPI00221FA272|nr:uncharacterized protein EV154DRAFT_494067 [Mucor mucedo]KAI7895882.1 hypothetical protein EV154DRAFT_494067 [Mucor mucedo]